MLVPRKKNNIHFLIELIHSEAHIIDKVYSSGGQTPKFCSVSKAASCMPDRPTKPWLDLADRKERHQATFKELPMITHRLVRLFLLYCAPACQHPI